MATREQVARRAVGRKRQDQADRANATFLGFCQRHGVAVGSESLMLHLADLHGRGASGTSLRQQLQLLDLSARLSGRPPWSHDPDVARLMVGLHRQRPLGGAARGLPIYRELVEALVDATMEPTHEQRRGRAVILLADDTGASAMALSALQWDDLTLRHDRLEICWPQAKRGRTRRVTQTTTPPVIAALRELRAHVPDRSGAVFASAWGHRDYQKTVDYCSLLPGWDRSALRRPTLGAGPELDAVLNRVSRPGPQQLRDRALLLLSFWAALRGREAISARASWIRSHPRGLVVELPGRRTTVGVHATHGDPYCPVDAWIAWRQSVTEARLSDPDGFAFLQVSGSRVWPVPLTPPGLNYLVQQRADQAGLRDGYVFTSLRSGWIRHAIRSGEAAHEVAAQADLHSLSSVSRHERRENLLRDNVAGRLGL